MTRSLADRVVATAVLLFVAALQVHRVDDSDTWWHLATGRLIAATGHVPRVDPFSYAAAGTPWINRQWLFEIGLYGLWRAAGPAGIALGTGVLFLAAFACAYLLARRSLPAWAAATLVFVAAEAAVERFTIRPEAATICFLAVELLLLDGAVGWGTVVALVVLQIVWANMHALSVLALVPLGAELGGALAARWLPLPAAWRAASARPPAERRRLAVAVVAVALAGAITPFGLAGAAYPLWLLTLIQGKDVLSYTIIEHRATNLAELSPAAARGFIILLVLAGVAALASLRRVRADAWLAARRGLRPALALGLALVFLTATARVVTGGYYRDARLTRVFGLGESQLLFPAGAVDFLQREAPDVRVFNDDGQGGFLLWRAFPPRQVFVDGRLQVYPPAIWADYQRVLDDPSRFPEVAARWKVGAVLLHHPSPGRLELATAIARMPGWRVAYLDGGGVVLLADGRPPGPPVGATGPLSATSTTGLAALLERALAFVRPEAETATVYYQRGRAILSLFGRGGAPAAQADFEAALRLRPDYDKAAEGRRVALALERP